MRGAGLRLVVDPTACDGYGSCAELLPEWITPDEWGYPMIPAEALPAELVGLARRAVKACPKLALSLERSGAPLRRPTGTAPAP